MPCEGCGADAFEGDSCPACGRPSAAAARRAAAEASVASYGRQITIATALAVAAVLAVVAAVWSASGGDPVVKPGVPPAMVAPSNDPTPPVSLDISQLGEFGAGTEVELRRLRDACQRGVMLSCDQLYWQAALDSADWAFGDTCGDRNEPSGWCVNVHGPHILR